MLLPLLRSVALVAALSLASLAASAQTFGEFLSKPELPITFMGVDFSATRYYGPPLTVDEGEMKGLFTKIDELLVKESGKYDIANALHRAGPTLYAISIAESVNQQIDPNTILVPGELSSRPAFTPQTIQDMVRRYTYPTGSSGVGLVFVVEEIIKTQEQEGFWVAFVDLNTRQVLFTSRMAATGSGFGFRNHWAHPLNDGIKAMKTYYGRWKKKYAQS